MASPAARSPFVLALALVAACGDSKSPSNDPADAGLQPVDASADGGAGSSEAGAASDAAQGNDDGDAGESGLDAAADAGMDGAAEADAGDLDAGVTQTDAGTDAGADAGMDAGVDAGDAASPPATGFDAHRTGTDRIAAPTLAELQTAASKSAALGGSGLRDCAALTLYPYRDAVMPRGRLAPVVAWAEAGSALYLRARFEGRTDVDYELAQSGTDLTDLTIPQVDWDALTQAGEGKLVLVLAKRGSQGAQACELSIEIAPAALAGDVYYSTYNSPAANGVGAVLRLPLDATSSSMALYDPVASAPVGPCISCHTASAGGSTLVAAKHLYFPATFTASSYAVPAVQPAPVAEVSNPFAALTPDGGLALLMGNPGCTQGANGFPRAALNFPMLVGPSVAKLVDTKTGNTVTSSGLGASRYMWMPQFSRDGRHVVFNDARPDGMGGTERGELAVADFDPATRAFSNVRTLVSRATISARIPAAQALDYQPRPVDLLSLGGFLTPVPGSDNCANAWTGDADHVGAIQGGSSSGPRYPAWPTFTPDGKGVVFSLVSEPDFAITLPGRTEAAKGELWYVDVASGELVRLAAANAGLSADEGLSNFYPSFLPTSYGGYQWLFFTTMRRVGSDPLDAVPADPGGTAGFGVNASKKRIWVSAISPRGTGALTDPSHAPFYLAEQSATINTRPVAVNRAP